jgi:hypothetical protein
MRFVIVPGIAGSMSGRLRRCDQKPCRLWQLERSLATL